MSLTSLIQQRILLKERISKIKTRYAQMGGADYRVLATETRGDYSELHGVEKELKRMDRALRIWAIEILLESSRSEMLKECQLICQVVAAAIKLGLDYELSDLDHLHNLAEDYARVDRERGKELLRIIS